MLCISRFRCPIPARIAIPMSCHLSRFEAVAGRSRKHASSRKWHAYFRTDGQQPRLAKNLDTFVSHVAHGEFVLLMGE